MVSCHVLRYPRVPGAGSRFGDFTYAKFGKRGIEVHSVNHSIHHAGLDVAGPVGAGNDAATALEELAFAAVIWAVVLDSGCQL